MALVKRYAYVLEECFFLLSTIRHRLIHYGGSSSRFTCNCHTRRVTTKLGNILLNPFKSKVHIQETSIEGTVRLDVVSCKESKSTEPILDGNSYEIVTIGAQKFGRIKSCGAEKRISSAVYQRVSVLIFVELRFNQAKLTNPHEHGKISSCCRSKDIQEQTILISRSRNKAVLWWSFRRSACLRALRWVGGRRNW